MIDEKDNPFSIWKHIHFIGKINLDLANPVLYRYELFSRLKTMYHKNEIVFPSPILWPDLFEQRLLSNSFLKYCFGKKAAAYSQKIYAICCTGDGIENADAQWNTRKPKKRDFCIRYSINLWKLLSCLDDFSQKNDGCIDFYLSSMSYRYSQEELIENRHIQALNDDKSIEDRICYLIRAMSFKRRQFKFENEIRIWAIVKDEALSSGMIKRNVLHIPLDWKCLEQNILVGPYKRDIKVEAFEKLKDYNQKKRNDGNTVQKNWRDEVVRALSLSQKRVRSTRIYNVPLWKCSKKLKSNLKK